MLSCILSDSLLVYLESQVVVSSPSFTKQFTKASVWLQDEGEDIVSHNERTRECLEFCRRKINSFLVVSMKWTAFSHLNDSYKRRKRRTHNAKT